MSIIWGHHQKYRYRYLNWDAIIGALLIVAGWGVVWFLYEVLK